MDGLDLSALGNVLRLSQGFGGGLAGFAGGGGLPSLPIPAGLSQPQTAQPAPLAPASATNPEATMSELDFKVANLLTRFTPDQITSRFDQMGLGGELGPLLQDSLQRLSGAEAPQGAELPAQVPGVATPQSSAVAQAIPSGAPTATGESELTADLSNTIGSLEQEIGTGISNDIDSELAQAIQAPETATGFQAMFQSGEFKELLLQAGLRMSQGQNFGEAVAGGAIAARDRTAQKNALLDQEEQNDFENSLKKAQNTREDAKAGLAIKRSKLDEKLANADIAKSIAQTGKANAETRVLLKELISTSKGTIADKDYSKIYGDMLVEVQAQDFTAPKGSENFLDAETQTRYLLNSTLPPTSRRYGPLKAVYVSELKDLGAQANAGTATEAEVESRIDEYLIAFGPKATQRMLESFGLGANSTKTGALSE